MEKFSYYNHLSISKESKTMPEIINLIKNGTFQKEIDLVRKYHISNQEKLKDQVKLKLPSFTPSGTFDNPRSNDSISTYSNIIHLDIDKLSKNEITNMTSLLCENNKVHAFFISPSGDGIKVFFRIKSTKDNHIINIKKLFKYAKSEWGIKSDEQCKDLSRLCFLSYDPSAYLNTDSEILSFENDFKDNFLEKAFQETNSKHQYKKGNRNNFIWTFSRICKSYNVPIDSTINFSISKFNDMPQKEIYRTVRSGYMNKYDLKLKSHNETKGFGKYKLIEDILNHEHDFRNNIITGCVEYKLKIHNNFINVNDYDFNNLRRILDSNSCKTSKDDLQTVLYSNFSKNYNPFTEYLENLPEWDGFDHIGDLACTIEVENPEYFKKCLKRWLIAMIASVLDDDIVNQHVLVLVGDQGIGKTTWLNRICPPTLVKYVYNGSINVNDKDSLIMLSESIIINVDEMEALSRKQIEQFKELITKVSIRVRRPYGRLPENMPRRASFCASLNNKAFLNDPTGSRRFLVHDVLSIENNHKLDIDLIYSHALHLYLNGEKYWFDSDEIHQINVMNRGYQVESTEEELLLNHYEPTLAYEVCEYLSSTEIILKIQDQYDNNIRLYNTTMGKMLAKNNFIQVSHKGRKKWKVKRVSKKN